VVVDPNVFISAALKEKTPPETALATLSACSGGVTPGDVVYNLLCRPTARIPCINAADHAGWPTDMACSRRSPRDRCRTSALYQNPSIEALRN
jgi:hypothetical protein